MITILCTETTGLPLWDKPPSDPAQPRIVEIAAVQYDRDRAVINQFCAVLRRDGWTSTKGAKELHNIPETWNDRYGVDPVRPLGMLIGNEKYRGMLAGSKVLVGANLGFQQRMVEIELHAMARRTAPTEPFKLPPVWKAPWRREIDVGEEAGKAAGHGKRMPLETAYEATLGKPFKMTRRASHDLQGAADIFWKLVETGRIEV